MEYKKYNKLENKTRSRLIENKPVVTTGERERGRGKIGVGKKKKRVIMGLYEIMYVKFLKTVKHYRI